MKTYTVSVEIEVAAGNTKRRLKRLLQANGFKLIAKKKNAWHLSASITSDMDADGVNNSIRSLIQTIPSVNVHFTKEAGIKTEAARVIWMPCDQYFDQSCVNYN